MFFFLGWHDFASFWRKTEEIEENKNKKAQREREGVLSLIKKVYLLGEDEKLLSLERIGTA